MDMSMVWLKRVLTLCATAVSGLVGAAGDYRQAPLPVVDLAAQADRLAEQAVRHEHGEGVPRDPQLAAALYCEAARLGHADATYALAWMYANGRGIPRQDGYAAALLQRLPADYTQAQTLARYLSDPAEEPDCLRYPAAMFADSEWNRQGLDLDKLRPEQREIAQIVVELAPQYQVHPQFALAIALTESALNPRAVSPKNAQGVMQLIPETAARFQVRDAFDPHENIKGGLRYLQWLLAYFEGDVMLASAAYNAGERAVERYKGIPPYQETRAYVEKVMSLMGQRSHPYDPSVTPPSPILAQRSN
jgi:soluble lytic murein transglycosylase-like protein